MESELPVRREVPFARAFHCGDRESGCTGDQACTCGCGDGVSLSDGLPTCCPRRREAVAWFEALPLGERAAYGLHGATGPFPGVGFGIVRRNPFRAGAVAVQPSPPPAPRGPAA